jgi:hypothetical protein
MQTKKYLVQVEFDSGVSAYWIHHISILMSVSEFDIYTQLGYDVIYNTNRSYTMNQLIIFIV